MSRKMLDCREMPSDMNCSIKISADELPELMEAGVQHAISVHGHEDGSELRDTLSGLVKDETAG